MADRKNLSNPRCPVIEFDEDDDVPDEKEEEQEEEEEEEIEIDCEDDSHLSNKSSQSNTVCQSTISSGDVSVESVTKELESLKSPSHSSTEMFTPSPSNNSNDNNIRNNNNSSSSSSNNVEGEQPSISGVGAFSGRPVRFPLRSITGEVEEKEGETNKSKALVSKNDKNQHGSNSDWKEKTRDWLKKNISMSSSTSSSSIRPTFTLTSGATNLPIVRSNPSVHRPHSQAELPSSIIQQQGGSSSNTSDGENVTPPPHHIPFYFPSNSSSDIILNREENRHEGRCIGGHNTYQTIVKKKKVISSVRVTGPFGSNYAYEKTSCTTSKVTKLAPFSQSSPTPPPQSPCSSSGSNSETLLFKEPKVPPRKTRKRRTITGENESTSRRAIQGSNNLTTSSENRNELTLRDGATTSNNNNNNTNNVTNTLSTNFRGRQGARRVSMAPIFQPCGKRSKPSSMHNPIEFDSSSSSCSSTSSDIPLGATADFYGPESRSLRELKPRLGRSMKRKEFLTSTPLTRGISRRKTPYPPSSPRRRLQFDRNSCENKPINEDSSSSPSLESEGNTENDKNDNADSADADSMDLSDSERERNN